MCEIRLFKCVVPILYIKTILNCAKSIDYLTLMLYYDIDHKVGVVGVLYPQAVNLCFFTGFMLRGITVKQTNVRFVFQNSALLTIVRNAVFWQLFRSLFLCSLVSTSPAL